MTTEGIEIEVIEAAEGEPQNWKPKILIIGGLIGLLTGLGAAYLLVQRAEREQTPPKLTAGEGVKLGVLVFGLLRQVSQLGE